MCKLVARFITDHLSAVLRRTYDIAYFNLCTQICVSGYTGGSKLDHHDVKRRMHGHINIKGAVESSQKRVKIGVEKEARGRRA